MVYDRLIVMLKKSYLQKKPLRHVQKYQKKVIYIDVEYPHTNAPQYMPRCLNVSTVPDVA